MPTATAAPRLPHRANRLAHRLAVHGDRGAHALLARWLHSRGWSTSVVAFPGYAVGDRVRVLGRALLAPPAAGVQAPAAEAVRGWRRLLTLEEAGVEVRVSVGGQVVSSHSDRNGLFDVSLEVPGGVDGRPVLLQVGDREPVRVPVRVFDSGATTGVVCDIDDTVWLTGLRHPWRAAWRTFAQTGADRRPVHGMGQLLQHLVHERGLPVVYLSNGPWNMAPPVVRFLHRHGFPPGALLMTDWGLTADGWFRDGQEHKRSSMAQLRRDLPHVRWTLVGDDGEHDPHLYIDAARDDAQRVAAVLLRQVAPEGGVDLCGVDLVDRVGDVPVVRGRDGEALLRAYRERTGATGSGLDGTDDRPSRLETPDEPVLDGSDPVVPRWFLTPDQRGNDNTRIPVWSTGNSVTALVHGRTYFPALLQALQDVGTGDLVVLSDWRGDPDQRLSDDGPTVAEALAAAADNGAVVKGLLWRSHLDRLRFSADQNRDLSEGLAEHGAEVLLDQRVRPLGSHHQKLVVFRHGDDVTRDVAFLGGIDLAHSRRDDAEHGGDPQRQPFASPYGSSPAWHDVQLMLRGPVVRDVEDTFRERWQDPAALSRLPWHVLPDLLRGTDRDADRLPRPAPPPPAAGRCAVQLLRTYPNRWPGYPFAPDGERTVARGYAKALLRARRLVYIEDQYLWSTSIARVFAAALRRSPELRLVVVVPRFPDQDGTLSLPASLLGHARALHLVREAGGDRVLVVDVENREGESVYVHAKVCVVDDVWATVGSDNFNRRSWTHDSELSAAVLDAERDEREPTDPAGLGDGARRFARDLRLELWREHLDRAEGDDNDLADPDGGVEALWRSAVELERWHCDGRQGPRPPGRLRPHHVDSPPRALRLLTAPLYRTILDPDGRPPRMRLRNLY